MNSPRLPNGSGLKQQIIPPADFTNPLKLLEEIVGRPIYDEGEEHGEEHGEERGFQLEKPAELVEDVDFGGRSMQDFLNGEDDRHDIGSLDYYGDIAQSAMECKYVYSYNIAKVLILNLGFR